MDILLDLWLNTVYNDEQVQGSDVAPVVYIRNGSGNPLISYAELAQRYNVSKATIGRYLKKFEELELISISSFPGTHGTVISLRNYLSTMFQISDVMLDKTALVSQMLSMFFCECQHIKHHGKGLMNGAYIRKR